MSFTPELYEIIVKIIDDRVREIKVTREEFDKLTSAVRELAEAQRRTEERLDQLAERVDKLAEAQRRTEERLNQLAEAQRRTEEKIEKLAEAVDALRREVGRLSETIGFGLEDIARVVLPGWLYRHLGIEVELERKIIELEDREVEVDLYGEAVKEGERLLVVGECKSRIYDRDVERFYREIYETILKKGKAIGVLFGYVIHPSAQRRAKELGIYVVASYQR